MSIVIARPSSTTTAAHISDAVLASSGCNAELTAESHRLRQDVFAASRMPLEPLAGPP